MSSEPVVDTKTVAMWDYNTCPTPEDLDTSLVTDRIIEGLRAKNFTGPVLIKVYGSRRVISKRLKETLESTGVTVTRVPNDHDVTNIMILDAFEWAKENPPPSNVMFITGDGAVFVDAFKQLKDKGHTTIVVHP